MKTTIISIFLFTSLLSGGIDTVWTKSFDSGSGDIGYSVEQTTDGGFVVAGYTNWEVTVGSDIWLIKMDSLGNEEWNQTFVGSNYYELVTNYPLVKL